MCKRRKKIISTIAIIIAMIFAIPNTLPWTGMIAKAATVELSRNRATLYPTETLQLKMLGTTKAVTWNSSETSVATVNSQGLIIAKKAGTVTISAKVNGKKYDCKLTVRKPALCTTHDRREREKVLCNVGNEFALSLRGSKNALGWKSSNKKVATVMNGEVRVVGKGKCTITATDTKTKKSYSCRVIVNDWLHANVKSLKMKVGESKTIKVYYDMTWGDVPYSINWFENVEDGKELLGAGKWSKWMRNKKYGKDSGCGYWTLTVTAKKPGNTVIYLTTYDIYDEDDYLSYMNAGEKADFWKYAEDQEYIEIPVTVTK